MQKKSIDKAYLLRYALSMLYIRFVYALYTLYLPERRPVVHLPGIVEKSPENRDDQQ
jgi:hypothetical protein